MIFRCFVHASSNDVELVVEFSSPEWLGQILACGAAAAAAAAVADAGRRRRRRRQEEETRFGFTTAATMA